MLSDGADDEARGEADADGGVLGAGARALSREEDERRRSDEQRDEDDLDDRPDEALRGVQAVGAVQRETLVQEERAGEDAADEADESDDGVEVAARDAQDHAERAAQEHQGADHHAEAEHEAGHRGGAAAGRELLLCQGEQEAAEDEAHELGANVLNCLGAVQAEAARGVADEARDAEAHVRGVAEEHEHRSDDADDGAAGDDRDLLVL